MSGIKFALYTKVHPNTKEAITKAHEIGLIGHETMRDLINNLEHENSQNTTK